MLVAVTIAFVGLNEIQTRLEGLSTGESEDPLWASNQLEFELLRLNQDLAIFAEDDRIVTAKQVNNRFDILWSRLSMLRSGVIGSKTAEYEQVTPILEKLEEELVAQDPVIVPLQDGDISTAKQLFDVFSQYERIVHDLTLIVVTERSKQDANTRNTLLLISRSVVGISIIIGVVSLIMGAFFWLEARRHHRLSNENLKLLAEARTAYEVKSQFISTMNHELRTPLTAIRGSIDLVCSGAFGELPPKVSDLLFISQRNTKRLSRLVDDILDVSKLEAGQFTYDIEAISSEDILSDALKNNEPYARDQQIELKILSKDDPLVSW